MCIDISMGEMMPVFICMRNVHVGIYVYVTLAFHKCMYVLSRQVIKNQKMVLSLSVLNLSIHRICLKTIFISITENLNEEWMWTLNIVSAVIWPVYFISKLQNLFYFILISNKRITKQDIFKKIFIYKLQRNRIELHLFFTRKKNHKNHLPHTYSNGFHSEFAIFAIGLS